MNPAPRPIATQPAPKTEPTDHAPLGVFDAMNIIVGIVIGTTIFKTAPLIFAESLSPTNALVIWTIGGVLAFIGALCYAELATSFPRSGGDYVYLTRAFGPWAGFLFSWTQLLIVLPCSIGTMAVVFGEYATQLHDLSQDIPIGVSSLVLYAGIAILAITLFNLIGVVLGKWVQNLLSLVKIVGVVAIIVAGFGWGDWSEVQSWSAPSLTPEGFMPRSPTDTVWDHFSVALIIIMYAFGGWNDAAFVAAEVRDPGRQIPRALLLGLGLITALYLLVNLAYLVGLGYTGASNMGELIPLRVLQQAFGENASKAMSALVMVSALGAVNGLIFTGARVYATLGKYRLFGFLGHWKPGHGAPILALLVQAIITLALVAAFGTEQGQSIVNGALDQVTGLRVWWAGIEPGTEEASRLSVALQGDVNPNSTFDKLFAVSAPFFWLFFLATGLSLFVLRDQTRPETRPFSVPLYPILPLIFCNVCAWMMYRAYQYMDAPWINVKPIFPFIAAVVLLGLPIYWISKQMGLRDPDEGQ